MRCGMAEMMINFGAVTIAAVNITTLALVCAGMIRG